jgi:hypothetical protein
MVEPLRDEHVRQQARAGRTARDRLRRQRRLHRLDVVPLPFASPAQVGRSFQNADEPTGRAIVQTLGEVGADADAHLPAARAGLLRLGEFQHFPLAGQIGATRPPAVASTLPHHLGVGRFGRWRRRCFLGEGAEVEERRAFDALRAPAEGQTHEVLNVDLLPVDGRPQLRDRREQLGDHLLEDTGVVGQVRRIECGRRHGRAHALVDAAAGPAIPAPVQNPWKKCSA